MMGGAAALIVVIIVYLGENGEFNYLSMTN